MRSENVLAINLAKDLSSALLETKTVLPTKDSSPIIESLVNWFCFLACGNHSIIRHRYNILNSIWDDNFYLCTDSTEAEDILSQSSKPYLIRLSDTRPGAIILTFRSTSTSKICHSRIIVNHFVDANELLAHITELLR